MSFAFDKLFTLKPKSIFYYVQHFEIHFPHQFVINNSISLINPFSAQNYMYFFIFIIFSRFYRQHTILSLFICEPKFLS